MVTRWVPGTRALASYKLIGPLDLDHFFSTLDAAVDAFRRNTGAEWTPSEPTGTDRA
jgi:hypothetical protein